MQKIHFSAVTALLSFLFCLGCASAPAVHELSGEAWGTTYSIKIVASDDDFDADKVSGALKNTLREVDESLSNWNPDSEISRFNQHASVTPFAISAIMNAVIGAAGEVHEKSEGYFDLTLGPIIELWGFGAGTAQNEDQADPPSDAEIEAAMTNVGQSSFLIHRPAKSEISLKNPDVTIFLSALAKGAGIDEIAKTLGELGYDNYLIEVGGDLIAIGSGPAGQGWRIAVEQPRRGVRVAGETLTLQGQAMATSGDYRNYFEKDGVRYSHIIDPRSGRPISHGTASVTVLSDKAVFADAWATALLAAGVERGLRIADREGIAALFISRSDNKGPKAFMITKSSAFERLMAKSLD